MQNDYSDPLAHWGLRQTINVCGTKTGIGASRVKPQVIQAVNAVLSEFVDIDELQSRASKVIATSTGAEAGCITDCSAAGVCQSVAAAIVGTDLAAIELLPHCHNRERRVIVPAGHLINYGGPVAQMVTVAGAELVSIGTAAQCEVYHLRHALELGAAAAVYVVSHHTVREGELPLSLFIETCQQFDVPVIVDMASEFDLTTPVELGASAAIYSGHKFLSGITSGIVAGRKDFIRSVYLQSRGIGRLMKVGKEGIVGAMVALELWRTRDEQAISESEFAIVGHWQQVLAGIEGVSVELHDDWTGNPITRLQLKVDGPRAKLFAWELATRLAAREPAVIVRDDLSEHGLLYLDPCNVSSAEAQQAAQAIVDELDKARRSGDGCAMDWSDVKRSRAQLPLTWPD